jgi:hypothetical protein
MVVLFGVVALPWLLINLLGLKSKPKAIAVSLLAYDGPTRLGRSLPENLVHPRTALQPATTSPWVRCVGGGVATTRWRRLLLLSRLMLPQAVCLFMGGGTVKEKKDKLKD